MCIYDLLSLFLFLLFVFNYRKDFRNGNYSRAFYAGVAAILFVMCFKSPNTGEGLGDLQEYVNLYLGKQSMYDSEDVEPGLKWLCNFLNIFPTSEFLYISVTSLIIMSPIIIGIKLHSNNKLYSLLLLFVYQGVWLVVYIAMRQALAQFFLTSAVLVFINRDRVKYWKLITVGLLVASTYCHSTPYILIPLTVLSFFLPSNKKYLYAALILSLCLSDVMFTFLAHSFLQYFGGFTEVDRISVYIENESYGLDMGFNLLNFLPITILTGLMLKYADMSSKNAVFVKALILGVVLYNLLGNIPLVNRAVCFLFILGIIGAVPVIKSRNQFIYLSILAFFFLWRNHVHYLSAPHSAFLPYHFIWE